MITMRGKGGGFSLQRPPEQISNGEVVRSMETHFNWVECFDPAAQRWRFLPSCGLKHLLARAGDAYLQVLDAMTLSSRVWKLGLDDSVGQAPGYNAIILPRESRP